MKITGSNVTIMVKDMDKAIAFYLSLGLTLKQRWDNHYAMIDGPGITLGIHPAEEGTSNSGTLSIGFMIDDITGAKQLLKDHKIECEEQADGKSGIYLHFKDHDGTLLYFVKPKW